MHAKPTCLCTKPNKKNQNTARETLKYKNYSLALQMETWRALITTNEVSTFATGVTSVVIMAFSRSFVVRMFWTGARLFLRFLALRRGYERLDLLQRQCKDSEIGNLCQKERKKLQKLVKFEVFKSAIFACCVRDSLKGYLQP